MRTEISLNLFMGLLLVVLPLGGLGVSDRLKPGLHTLSSAARMGYHVPGGTRPYHKQ